MMVAVTLVSAQQDACSDLIQQALDFTDRVCNDAGRNQVCYGNILLSAVPVEDAPEFSFEAPGDIADLIYIDALQLSQLESPDEWGVALLRLQANLPDTLPGQNVTVLLFGDVAIENAGEEPPPMLTGTIASNANLRGGPGTNFAVVGSGTAGMEVTIDGRNEAGDWFRMILPENDESAWIINSLIEIEGDIETLPVMTADDESGGTNFGPMQAFYFRTGVGELQCVSAPPNGILVQTPQGQGEVLIRANEVDITLGSTAFLRAVPNDYMTVDLVEGEARVTALDATVFVSAGARARIPLDAEGLPSGAPELVVYELDDIANLPTDNLERDINIAEPLSEDELVGNSVVGDWILVEDFPGFVCGSGSGGVRNESGGAGVTFTTTLTDRGIHYVVNINGFEADLAQTGFRKYSSIISADETRVSLIQIEWTSDSGGVYTATSQFTLPDCVETFTQQAAFERVG
jgi:hypothetical protein